EAVASTAEHTAARWPPDRLPYRLIGNRHRDVCIRGPATGEGERTPSVPPLPLPAQPLDRRPTCRELVLDPLEAAVEMVDAVDHGLALGGETGDDQRHRGAEVGRHHLGAPEPVDAGDGGDLAIEMDVSAEPGELLHVHEAILEDGLADLRDAVGP